MYLWVHMTKFTSVKGVEVRGQPQRLFLPRESSAFFFSELFSQFYYNIIIPFTPVGLKVSLQG